MYRGLNHVFYLLLIYRKPIFEGCTSHASGYSEKAIEAPLGLLRTVISTFEKTKNVCVRIFEYIKYLYMFLAECQYKKNVTTGWVTLECTFSMPWDKWITKCMRWD